jgi:hypothetical protein
MRILIAALFVCLLAIPAHAERASRYAYGERTARTPIGPTPILTSARGRRQHPPTKR